MSKSTPSVVRIDHGVIPTNDLGKSLSFFTDVLGARFVLNGLQGTKIKRDGMVFEAVKVVIRQHDLRRPKRTLIGAGWKPYIEALEGFCVDMAACTSWAWADNSKFTRGKPSNLLLKCPDGAFFTTCDLNAKFLHHPRH